jgi:hypothetical protein
MQQITRMTFWYQRRSQPLIAAMFTDNPQVATVLTRRYAPILTAEETALDRLAELNLDARLLQHVGEQTILAEQLRVSKDADRGVAVSQRDIFDGLLRAYLRGLRENVARTYGRACLPRVGLSVVLPKNSIDLLLVGKNVESLLEKELNLPPTLAGVPPLDRQTMLDGLKFPLNSLDSAQTAVEARKREAQTATVDLIAARLDLRRVYTNVGRRIEGSYRLAGFDALADRLRETVREAGVVTQEDDEDPPADPTPVGTTPAGPPTDPTPDS